MLLKFLHPHQEFTIYDNSEVMEEASGGGTMAFIPFFSDKGPDSVLSREYDYLAFLNKFGTPRFRDHGQAIYNAIRWIVAGGRLAAMRLMPENATYSHFILNVQTRAAQLPVYKRWGDDPLFDEDSSYFKATDFAQDADGNRIIMTEEVDDGDGGTITQNVTKQGVIIRLVAEKIPLNPALSSLRTLDSDRLKTMLLNMDRKTPTQTDGSNTWQNHRIYLMAALGRGKYGNNISFTITPNKTEDVNYVFRNYTLQFTMTDNNANRVEMGPTMWFSTHPEAFNIYNERLDIEEVVRLYSEDVKVVASDERYDDLINDISAAFSGSDYNTDIEEIQDAPHALDFLFGYDRNGLPYEGIEVVNSAGGAGVLNIQSNAGVYFENGSDGDLDLINPVWQRNLDGSIKYTMNGSDFTTVEDIFGDFVRVPLTETNTTAKVYSSKEDLLQKAYTGRIDSGILDDERWPYTITLDANYSLSVKQAMADLAAELRPLSMVARLDTNFLPSVKEVLNWRAKRFQYNTRYVAINTQTLAVNDQYTKKEMMVTSTYFLANLIPNVHEEYDIHHPIAGMKYATLDQFNSINFLPDEYQKHDLYLARINYIEADLVSHRFMTDNTCQFQMTALSEARNVLVLIELCRRLKARGKWYLQQLDVPSVKKRFQEDVDTIVKSYIHRGACEVATAQITQTQQEKWLKIYRIKIYLVFVGTIQRILWDIEIGKSGVGQTI